MAQVVNAFYAQSGGVTAVINTTAAGVIETARAHPERIGTVYVGRNGILGALREDFMDTKHLSTEDLIRLQHTPGGAFGSCRYKLKPVDTHPEEYRRLIEVFKAHNIGIFFYNGGGDSQDTANKVAIMSQELGYPLQCIGIPKTVDNDLPLTDHCPGFGSVAKYVATSILEASLDVASMALTSTRVFILEVMGRHAGWIAAAGGLAQAHPLGAPHLILFPEIPFELEDFLLKVRQCVDTHGFCSIVASEGIKDPEGRFLAANGGVDAFGHAQLGGVAPRLAHFVQTRLHLKNHWAVADYLQRAARHIASATDVAHAYAVGKAAVEFAIQGQSAVMPIIVRDSDSPYRWHIEAVPLSQVANIERKMPRDFIREDGYGITEACRNYLAPLIAGEAYPPYQDGLPDYGLFSLPSVDKCLTPWQG